MAVCDQRHFTERGRPVAISHHTGVTVFILVSPYFSVFPTNRNSVYQLALTLFFLILAIVLKRKPGLSAYGTAVYALFIASAATLFLNTGILNLQRSTMPPLQNIAVDKFSQFLHVVPVIIGLTLLARDELFQSLTRCKSE